MNKIMLTMAIALMLFVETYGLPDPVDIYRTDNISDSMKKDANTVVRYEKNELEIYGPGKAGMHIRQVVTVLNEKGNSELFFYEFTSKMEVLDEVTIRLFDKTGRQIEKYTKKDLTSQAAGSGLVEDGMVFYIRLSAASYPITIEKDYIVRYRGFMQLPSFYFNKPNQSVEYFTLLVRYPASMKVNYKSYHIKEQPNRMSNGNGETFQWESRSLTASKYEDHAGSWVKGFPHISFNTDKIEYDGYTGNLSTWKDIGNWYNSLVGHTNRLSDTHQEEIRRLVAGVSEDREKIRILYTYLQNNFRYVSIQLGIGGFKPFPADFVHEKKYGDCKGLSNYMEACLSALNIKSYPLWIQAGADETSLDTSFAHLQFNHEILMVPLAKDTIWLECTSSNNDFGHLGSFTENRYALLLTEYGGKIVRSPTGKASDNTITSKTNIIVSAEGEAEIKVDFVSQGEYKYLMQGVSMETVEMRKQYLVNYFGFNNPDEFNMTFDTKEKIPFQSKMALDLEKVYEFKAGSKMFIRPRMYKIWSHKLEHVEKREQDYFLEHPLIKTDTTAYHLPDGMLVESLPKNKMVSFPLGKYESRYWYDEKSRTIFSTARMEINSYKIGPSLYEQARSFFDEVIADGNQKIICKNPN